MVLNYPCPSLALKQTIYKTKDTKQLKAKYTAQETNTIQTINNNTQHKTKSKTKQEEVKNGTLRKNERLKTGRGKKKMVEINLYT